MFAVTSSTVFTIVEFNPFLQIISTLLVIPLTAVTLHSKVAALPNSISILATSTAGLGTVNKQKCTCMY